MQGLNTFQVRFRSSPSGRSQRWPGRLCLFSLYSLVFGCSGSVLETLSIVIYEYIRLCTLKYHVIFINTIAILLQCPKSHHMKLDSTALELPALTHQSATKVRVLESEP